MVTNQIVDIKKSHLKKIRHCEEALRRSNPRRLGLGLELWPDRCSADIASQSLAMAQLMGSSQNLWRPGKRYSNSIRRL